MIYNLVAYLKTQFSTYSFVNDGWQKESPDTCICINDSGGTPSHTHNRTDYMVQVLSRSRDKVKAKEASSSVYEKLKNVFSLTLPATTIKSIVYPAVKTWQISPIQTPSFIGCDHEGRNLYSFNLKITTD